MLPNACQGIWQVNFETIEDKNWLTWFLLAADISHFIVQIAIFPWIWDGFRHLFLSFPLVFKRIDVRCYVLDDSGGEDDDGCSNDLRGLLATLSRLFHHFMARTGDTYVHLYPRALFGHLLAGNVQLNV